MLTDPSDPYSASLFLKNWALEIRAAYTPLDDLDPEVRLAEYLTTDMPPELEAPLVTAVTEATPRLLAEAEARERDWTGWTTNDLLAAAFRDLRLQGVFAREDAGLTIQDGWGYVGVEADPGAVGAVFFHQQDISDAIHGQSLPLAFGVCGGEPGSEKQVRELAVIVLETLSKYGVGTSWTGDVADRIEVAPFEWRRRRWTAPEGAPPGPEKPWRQEPKPPSLYPKPSRQDLEKYVQPVWAHYSTAGYDSYLSAVMRGVWMGEFHQQRGQVGHFGPPHVFVRSGEQAAFMPCDGLVNLDLEESARLRTRGMAARPSVEPMKDVKRSWWRFWA